MDFAKFIINHCIFTDFAYIGSKWTDHLGNVRLVYSDIRDGNEIEVLAVNGYYPFGFMMEKQAYQSNDRSHRYGFNGMEKDDEVKGRGNSYSTHFRQNDPRLGRWLSIDPKAASFPGLSPYVSMGNNPIMMVDMMGDRVKLNGFNEPEKAMDRAFGLWMVSDEGRDYLSQFAEAGQTLTVGELSITFDESGKYHNSGIDAVFTASYMGEGVPSRTPMYQIEGVDIYTVPKDENGRYQVEVLLNKDRTSWDAIDKEFMRKMNKYTYNVLVVDRIGTILHEAYVHQLFIAEAIRLNEGNEYWFYILHLLICKIRIKMK